MSLGACLVLWCLGTPLHSPPRVVAVQDVYRKGGDTARLVLGEAHGVMAGWIFQPSIADVAIVGWWPVHLRAGRVAVEGGAVVGSGPFPNRGTRTNWAARLRVDVTSRLGLEYVHFSNGNVRPNPSLDMVGLSVRMRGHK